MAKKTAPLLPATNVLLEQFGERLRLARLRRRLSAKQVCERAGMTPMTLRSLERGGSGVTVGAYLAVMQVLGIEDDLRLLGQEDALGRSLQDSRLPAPRVASKHAPTMAKATPKALPTADRKKGRRAAEPIATEIAQLGLRPSVDAKTLDEWAIGEEFISSNALADLVSATLPKKAR